MHSKAGMVKLSLTPFLLLVPVLGLSFQGCVIAVPLYEGRGECKLCKFVRVRIHLRDTITAMLMILVSKSAMGRAYTGD